jgi:OOP family OmpA-OmpF porin
MGCAPDTIFNGQTVIGVGQAPALPPPVKPPPPVVKPPAARVRINGNHVVITEKIQFEVNSAKIKPESNSLLDEIADVVKKSPQLKKVQVEGHSSSEGDAKANTQLSDDRAKSVVAALESRGVKPGLLVGKGFGSSVPIATNDNEAGREINRRVDFVILEPK